MKKNVPIETFIGAISNYDVDVVKSEGNRIIIETWDHKFREFELTSNSRGEYYQYFKDYDKLPE
jgi:hypothetical protein